MQKTRVNYRNHATISLITALKFKKAIYIKILTKCKEAIISIIFFRKKKLFPISKFIHHKQSLDRNSYLVNERNIAQRNMQFHINTYNNDIVYSTAIY